MPFQPTPNHGAEIFYAITGLISALIALLKIASTVLAKRDVIGKMITIAAAQAPPPAPASTVNGNGTATTLRLLATGAESTNAMILRLERDLTLVNKRMDRIELDTLAEFSKVAVENEKRLGELRAMIVDFRRDFDEYRNLKAS